MAIASFRAGEAISAGQAVFVSSTGFIYKASCLNPTQASVVGVSLDSGVSGDLLRVTTDSVYAGYSGLTPGEYRYLSISTSGSLVPYSTWLSQLATTVSGAYLESVGKAITSSGLEVEPTAPLFVVYPLPSGA
jgi:hypothetical protein